MIQSAVCEGVTFRIARMSFARRLELTRRVRELGQRLEFERAGDALQDKICAAVTSGEIERLYLAWGLLGIEGLSIDGEPADTQAVIERAPESLCREILQAIRQECGLTEEERKN